MLNLNSDLRSISPLFLPLVALICSITLFSFLQQNLIGFYTLLIASLGCLIAFAGAFQTSLAGPLILSITFALIGWGRISQLNNHFESFPFESIEKTADIYGTVVEKKSGHNGRMKHSLLLKTSRVNTISTREHLLQIFTIKESKVQIGDSILIKNISIKKPGHGEYQLYLKKEGISATSFVDKFDPKIEYRPLFSLSNWLHNKKITMLTHFKKRLSPIALTLYASLFLGEKGSYKSILERIQNQCKQWGILHYLARSGLHLVIVLSVYEKILRAMPLPFTLKQIILLLLAGIYFLLSWPSISFIRAFIVFLLYKLFMLTYNQINFLHILNLTCILILVANPYQLYFLDFQLSFCLTFALAWINQYKTLKK